MTNRAPTGSVTVTNTSLRPLDFVIGKTSHVEFTDSASTQVTSGALSWLAIGEAGSTVMASSVTVRIDAGASKTIQFVNPGAGVTVPSLWEGRISIDTTAGTLDAHVVNLRYAATPDGRWAGKAYYFTQFGTQNLDTWAAARTNATLGNQVGNAFVRKWSALRNANLSLDEFMAISNSTVDESWHWASTRTACSTYHPAAAACYLYSNPGSPVEVYSDSLDSAPIPSGVVELPMAIDIHAVAGGGFEGRIASDVALHYPGDPKVTLQFTTTPSACNALSGSECLTTLQSFGANVTVGGRYQTTSADTNCASGPVGATSDFQLLAAPWLLPDFLGGTELDMTGNRVRYECRDRRLPATGTAASVLASNLAAASANPIPDGRSRQRQVALIDGMIVNQDRMLILFRERYVGTFLGGASPAPFDAYGYMVLDRTNTALLDADFAGSSQADARNYSNAPSLGAQASCTSELATEMGLPSNTNWASYSADDLVSRLLRGVPTPGAGQSLAPLYDTSNYATTNVHYLCGDTGTFDGAIDPATRVFEACPPGSNVRYFAFVGAPLVGTAASNHACNDTNSCGAQLEAWANNPASGVHVDPVWRCTNSNQAYCDTDRYNLRVGKEFFQAPPPGSPNVLGALATPLASEIDSAFRYRTQFQSRQGRSIGFTPSVCAENSNAVPYCFDPGAIEQIRRRVDCLTQVFNTRYVDLSTQNKTDVATFLKSNFSVDSVNARDGFERLHSQLVVMLGDDAYTSAFQSRFDLAGEARAAFDGSKLEPNGINLSGIAGFEMQKLYQATQYYGLVLDRFYAQLPAIQTSLNQPLPAQQFISAATATSYLDRVLRASVQRARATSEIAKRYHALQRPDLARSVAQRGYSSAYIESVVIGQLMSRMVANASPVDRDQMREQMRQAGTVYRAALLEMRDVYSTLTDDLTYFGFAPDYIPMPPQDPGARNAFETMISRALQSTQIAASREEIALQSTRSFDTDSAAFQSELIRIRNTYENQLAQICGTMEGTDGLVYPAISTYAHLNSRASQLGNPCGLMGTGEIHESMAALDSRTTDVDLVLERSRSLQEQIDIELQRASTYCRTTILQANVQWQTQTGLDSLQAKINATNLTLQGIQRNMNRGIELAKLVKCTIGTSTDCGGAVTAAATMIGLMAAGEATTITNQVIVSRLEREEREIRTAQIRVTAANTCDLLRVDSNARIQTLSSQFGEIELQAVQADNQLRLAIDHIQQLRNTARRIEAQQQEQEDLTIDEQAARNDPNVRIYRNDSVINADEAFLRALQDAYRATRVFEYYTSQSYAHRVDLSLIRMVGHGDYNLQNYLARLQDAYYAFQETYGNPDTRVEVISLKDDILGIARIDDHGVAYTDVQRTNMFHEALADVRRLDSRGYLAVPFSTNLDRLSPLTRDHKIEHIEVQITGINTGDNVARVYLEQSGTGSVRGLDGNTSRFLFPEVTAVVNPVIRGARVYDAAVYRNERMRDRPFANTNWNFYFNQRDEAANRDVDLGGIDDIQILVYYTDFTSL